MASKIVQAAEKLSSALDWVRDDLTFRLWFGRYFGRLVDHAEKLSIVSLSNSRRFAEVVSDVSKLVDMFDDLVGQLQAEDDDTNWVTVVLRDPVAQFAMGYTLRVGPGTIRQVLLSPQREFPAGSIYEIQTESPGIALVDVRVGPQSMIAGTLRNDPRGQCSVRSGKIGEPCPVGTELRFDVCNHRTERETEEP